MASRDWHRAAVEAERQRDNAIAQLEYEQANRRRNDTEIAHERDDFIKELETVNTGMRTALVAIQELHKPAKGWISEREYLLYCADCGDATYPCKTRKLAYEGLGGGQDG